MCILNNLEPDARANCRPAGRPVRGPETCYPFRSLKAEDEAGRFEITRLKSS